MFTGLVREIGRIAGVRKGAGTTVVELAAPHACGSLAIGDSLAVNGICLTVTRLDRGRVSVDASPETLRATTLGRWRPGDPVHLEPALRAGDPMGGHVVLGHVDGTGTVVRTARAGASVRMTVALDAQLCWQLVPKGSIAVDGVSLTLDAGPFPGRFVVTLVPETLRATRLGHAAGGSRVNLEIDVLTKAAARDDRQPLRLATVLAYGWDHGRR